MNVDDAIKLIAAVVAALTVIAAGLRWLIGFVVDRFLKALDANTAAISSCAKAVTDSSAAAVAASMDMKLEVRELRVEVRTLLGMRPPAEEDISDDGEHPKLTPVRGVPDARGIYTLVRKTKE